MFLVNDNILYIYNTWCFLFPRGAFSDHCVTVVCKFQEEICNKAFGFRSAPQGIGSHVLNPKNLAASRCSRATIVTQGPSHCTTTSICTCQTYQHQQQPAGISVDAKQNVYCKMRSLLLGTWQSNAIKTRLCIHIMAHCNWANILFQRNDESHERTVPQHVVTCSYRSQVDLLASLCCLSICPNPLQPLQSKTEQTSSSFVLLPRKSLDKNCMTQQVNTEQVAMKIRAHKCTTAKSQSLNNQAKNPQNIMLVLFLRMDVNDSSDFFSKKNPTVRRILEYLNILKVDVLQ